MNLGSTVSVLVNVAVDKPYSYAVPAGMHVERGSIVRIPLGPRLAIGTVWGEPDDKIAHNKLRDIDHVFPVPPLPEEMLQLVDWIARYTLAQPGMVLRGILRSTEALDPAKPRIAYQMDGPPPERMTSARHRVLEEMANGLAYAKTALIGVTGVSASVIEGLVKSGTLKKVELPPAPVVAKPNPNHAPPTLNPDQQTAADAMSKAMAGRDHAFGVSLLDGVTGSGKTETYFEAVATCLNQGRQAIMLMPEIALTNTFIKRFEQRFGTRPGEWHSDMTPVQRARTWRAVANGEVPALVGARSALFLPFPDLGLIVVDEEHDQAFKQFDRVNYHARDMACVRASLCKAHVVLASATPSVESRHNANIGKYQHLMLTSRFSQTDLPDITTIDMRTDGPDKGQWISPLLRREIFSTIERGEQALLFLNRRGYAPLTLCRACGHRYQCANCTAWLVEHRFRGVLTCHHCGDEFRKPTKCHECNEEDTLIPIGPGIERIAEEVAERFPDAKRVILSSDMGTVAQMRQTFEDVARGEYDIIIGTQLVAKGHHFPKLTLVGVIDSDLGFAHGDPRAAERTFQLLTQVTGRAGRAAKKGKAYLQTYAPDHPVIKTMVAGDREGFYAHEIEVRREGMMPPFGRLAALIISCKEHDLAMNYARHILSKAPQAEDIRLFGPADAPVSLVRGRFRIRILAQSPKAFDLSAYVRFWLEQTDKATGNLRVQVDIDPVSFF